MAGSGKKDTAEQAEKFRQAAKELGCDENEAAWERRLRKIAQSKPKSETKKPAK